MTRNPQPPLVSIVIPVYNGADYLRQAIDSALAQSYPNIEVLVINDGSRDGDETARVARSYGTRIRYFEKPNGGVATALNAGIEAMRGDYFSWLSHDDVYHPTKVEAQVAAAAQFGPDTVVACAYELIDERSRPLPGDSPVPRASTVAAIFATSFNGCALLIPRRCFAVAGGFDPTLRTTQDSDMWLRIALAGFPFAYLPAVLVQSRQHAQQGSRTIDTHAEERSRWYLAAVEALPPDVLAAEGQAIGEMLLRRREVRAFRRFMERHHRACSTEATAVLAARLAIVLGRHLVAMLRAHALGAFRPRGVAGGSASSPAH